MEPNKKRSIGLLIRRFLAGYIFLSVVVQLIGEILEGEFSAQSLDDLAFGLLIVFFLAFYSRKKKVDQEPEEELDQPTVNTNYEDTENMNTFDVEEQFEDIEDFSDNQPTEDAKNNYKQKKVRRNNPINDKQSLLSRFFQGKTERY